MPPIESDGISVTYDSQCTRGDPDLRLLHYNDVYHVEYGPTSSKSLIAWSPDLNSYMEYC